MGSEDLFHKRRGTAGKSLQRRGALKDPAPLYLIVCEGEKTEPNYFNELRNYERISSISVRVCGDCGSAPISVVEHSESLYQELTKAGHSVQGVFCIFDRDTHESFDKACALALRLHKSGIPIEVVHSVPCFEYWVLLHYEFCRAPYSSQGRTTAAHLVYRHLQTHIKSYQKGSKGLYEQLKEKQPFAIENAVKVLQDSEDTGEKNPSTQIHTLIEKLLKFSNIKD